MPHPSDPSATGQPETEASTEVTGVARPAMSLSMHADVEVWCDCCSCEAEPYWTEAFAAAAEDETDH